MSMDWETITEGQNVDQTIDDATTIQKMGD